MYSGPVIDFHTHAFPDRLAPHAVGALETAGKTKAFLNGTVGDLIGSMDKAGIEKSVVCSIATRPSQFESILKWSVSIRSERLVPLPSIHPADPNALLRLHAIASEGFAGVKMHSYYQDFVLDEPRMLPLYEAMGSYGLFLVVHTGFDIAFPRVRRADPARVVKLAKMFPELLLITTHLGAMDDWDEVERLLVGKPIYMELSFAFPSLPCERVREILLRHPKDFALFGSDSPWLDQQQSVDQLRSLRLPEALESNIFFHNAARLLLR
ncbi:MAG TPA: amidohydrolase family protein [Dissulfurispiraceae bacterium]|nr:amidohydrolase family protein [Dissulfurispiraceae bacterium]